MTGPVRQLGLVSRQGVLIVATVLSVGPLVFMVLTALKSADEYAVNPIGWPRALTLENFRRALVDLPTLAWAANSLIVTVTSVVVATIVSALAAYAITFGRFRGRSTLMAGSIALIMVPPVVLVMPMFVTMLNLRLINSLGSVIVFYSCLLVPFSIFFLVNFFRTVPKELIEAATCDGASPWTALRMIVLPLSRPALVTIAVVNAIWAWNELLISLVFLQDERRRTLMAGLTLFQGRYVTDQPLVLAVATLSILPVAVFFLISQRSFVAGMTAGIGK